MKSLLMSILCFQARNARTLPADTFDIYSVQSFCSQIKDHGYQKKTCAACIQDTWVIITAGSINNKALELFYPSLNNAAP